MTNSIDLKEIEKKAYTSYVHDGMLDLCGGLVLLGFGISILVIGDFLLYAFIEWL